MYVLVILHLESMDLLRRTWQSTDQLELGGLVYFERGNGPIIFELLCHV